MSVQTIPTDKLIDLLGSNFTPTGCFFSEWNFFLCEELKQRISQSTLTEEHIEKLMTLSESKYIWLSSSAFDILCKVPERYIVDEKIIQTFFRHFGQNNFNGSIALQKVAIGQGLEKRHLEQIFELMSHDDCNVRHSACFFFSRVFPLGTDFCERVYQKFEDLARNEHNHLIRITAWEALQLYRNSRIGNSLNFERR